MSLQEQEQEQKQIEEGTRIAEIIQDAAYQSIIANFASENYKAFKEATTEDEIRIAHAKGRVLDELMSHFQVVIDRGAVAKIHRNERERRELQEAEIARNRQASIDRRNKTAS